MNHLFRGYNPSARPVLNSSSTVNVNLRFSLLQIQDLVRPIAPRVSYNGSYFTYLYELVEIYI